MKPGGAVSGDHEVDKPKDGVNRVLPSLSCPVTTTVELTTVISVPTSDPNASLRRSTQQILRDEDTILGVPLPRCVAFAKGPLWRMCADPWTVSI